MFLIEKWSLSDSKVSKKTFCSYWMYTMILTCMTNSKYLSSILRTFSLMAHKNFLNDHDLEAQN